MSLREWEVCSGKCPPSRPCPDDAENYRRAADGLPLLPPVIRNVQARQGPCRFLGERTGERVECPTCPLGPTGKAKTSLFLFKCEKFGQCTLQTKVRDVACCDHCRSWEPREPPPVPPLPQVLLPPPAVIQASPVGAVRNLLYHIYPVKGNGVWQWNVGQLLRRINLFNGRRVVKIVTDGKTDPAGDVKDLLTGHVHEFIELPNDSRMAEGREVNGFAELLGRVETANPHHVTFYGHAKGVTRVGQPAVRQWCEMLYETYLDHWQLVRGLLVQFPVAGAFLRTGHPLGWPPQAGWHYSGSFLWFRNAALFASPRWADPAIIGLGPEPYPSQFFSRNEAGVIFFEWPVQPLGMYQQHFIEKQVMPQLEAWRRARQAEKRQQAEAT